MESLPVEVIGSILSHLETVPGVVIASATCRKWREAWKIYLHALAIRSKDFNEWIEYNSREDVITQTLLQTNSRFERLSIVMDSYVRVDYLISWFTYSKDTLRELHCDFPTIPDVNIIEKCDLQKLEVLTLGNNIWVDPICQKFPCLRRVSISNAAVSENLNFLLTSCPNIEFLTLVGVHLVNSKRHKPLELSSNSLKDIHLKFMFIDKIILMADNIEKLHLEDCSFDNYFELTDKGTLKYLKIELVRVQIFYIGESAENLEVLDVSRSSFYLWPEFKSMISSSQKLRRLRIWKGIHMDMETIVAGFPLLTHLSLCYSHIDANHYEHNYDEAVDNELMAATTQWQADGSLQLQKMVVLELRWSTISPMFSFWVAMFLVRCPNLRKLVICGSNLDDLSDEGRSTLLKFTLSIMSFTRKYLHVEVEFKYHDAK